MKCIVLWPEAHRPEAHSTCDICISIVVPQWYVCMCSLITERWSEYMMCVNTYSPSMCWVFILYSLSTPPHSAHSQLSEQVCHPYWGHWLYIWRRSLYVRPWSGCQPYWVLSVHDVSWCLLSASDLGAIWSSGEHVWFLSSLGFCCLCISQS